MQHRLKCAELRFVDPPEPFRHGHGNHHDAEEWSARILFTVEDILDHPRGFELERFTTVAGKRIGKPQALMNLQVVHDIDGWTD